MAAPALTRAAWPVAAAVAAGLLAVLALHGERPGAGFARYEPAGPMVGIPPSEVTAVELSSPAGGRWRYVRLQAGGWRRGDGTPWGSRRDVVPVDALEDGLKFLHGSAPQRVMAPEELTGTPLSELGLAPPRLVVSVFTAAGAAPFVVELGAPNPQGLARYARVAGRGEVLLLNRYVAEAWEKAAR